MIDNKPAVFRELVRDADSITLEGFLDWERQTDFTDLVIDTIQSGKTFGEFARIHGMSFAAVQDAFKEVTSQHTPLIRFKDTDGKLEQDHTNLNFKWMIVAVSSDGKIEVSSEHHKDFSQIRAGVINPEDDSNDRPGVLMT